MYREKKLLAVIPARGGSKRLPNKNILDLCGKPLVGWTIEAALKSRYIDKVVLTSESDKILAIGKKYAIELLRRPEELAKDDTGSIDVVLHTLDHFNADYIILLQPTSPLRSNKHIDEAVEIFFQQEPKSLVSVKESFHPLSWCTTIEESGYLKPFCFDTTQKHYCLNGAIYIASTKDLKNKKTFFIDPIFPYIMDDYSSIDIDTKFDFLCAHAILKERDVRKT